MTTTARRPPSASGPHRADGTTFHGTADAVVKRSNRAGTSDRAAVEREALGLLADVIPVPRTLAGGDDSCVYMAFVPGMVVDDWFAAGLNAGGKVEAQRRQSCFLRKAGEVLRALHAFDASRARDVLPGTGRVVVHGDFTPSNVIVDPSSGEIRAVIDWEFARLGSAVEDLAWLEWHLRIWSKAGAAVLKELYEGYGARPSWERRHLAMLRRCRAAQVEAAPQRRQEKARLLTEAEAFVDLLER